MDEQQLITSKELDEVLSKYFKTLEDIQKDNDIKIKELEEKQAKELEEIQTKELTNVEFQNELLKEIKTLQEFTKFGNNMFYVGMVAIGLILMYVLFYKFLNKFI